MAVDPNCIFCKIAAGEIPSVQVAASANAYCFMDIGPISRGHALVIPRQHYENLFELPPGLAGELHELAARVAPVLRQAVGAEGLNILQNNGRAAGQVVMHYHVHLIPRRADDGLKWPWPATKAEPRELQEIAAKVAAGLAKS